MLKIPSLSYTNKSKTTLAVAFIAGGALIVLLLLLAKTYYNNYYATKYEGVCDGDNAIGTCLAGGVCLAGLVCTADKFCCQCPMGKSPGPCMGEHKLCPEGYSCYENGHCCSTHDPCIDGFCPEGFYCVNESRLCMPAVWTDGSPFNETTIATMSTGSIMPKIIGLSDAGNSSVNPKTGSTVAGAAKTTTLGSATTAASTAESV